MADGLALQVDSTEQFNRAIRALIGSTPEIIEGTDKALHEMADLAAEDAKFNITWAPTKKKYHTGLRLLIARGVFVRALDDGSGYLIGTSMPKEDMAIIPRGFDIAVGGHWRHPLFEDKSRQYENYGFTSWFMLPMNEATDDGRARLVSLLEQVAESVAAQSE